MSMSIDELLNEIIGEIEEGKKSLFASRKTIDAEFVLTILQEIQAALPHELSQARQVLGERDRILGEARRLASEMIEEAKQRIDDSVVNHEVVQQAYEKSNEIIEDAQRRAYELRVSADDYALSVLDDLTSYISEYSSIVEENKSNFLNRIHRQAADLT